MLLKNEKVVLHHSKMEHGEPCTRQMSDEPWKFLCKLAHGFAVGTVPHMYTFIFNVRDHRTSSQYYDWLWSGARLNIKMPSYQYRDSHVKAKTVSSTVLSLTWESPYLGKTVFILRRGPAGSEAYLLCRTKQSMSAWCCSNGDLGVSVKCLGLSTRLLKIVIYNNAAGCCVCSFWLDCELVFSHSGASWVPSNL